MQSCLGHRLQRSRIQCNAGIRTSSSDVLRAILAVELEPNTVAFMRTSKAEHGERPCAPWRSLSSAARGNAFNHVSFAAGTARASLLAVPRQTHVQTGLQGHDVPPLLSGPLSLPPHPLPALALRQPRTRCTAQPGRHARVQQALRAGAELSASQCGPNVPSAARRRGVSTFWRGTSA